MPRALTIAATECTEYRLRSADEMEEVLHGVVETYLDFEANGLDADVADIYRCVEHDTTIIARRDRGEQELAAAGVL